MRIIAGTNKGRGLKAPKWDGLRPTSDKLRETLFNILAPHVMDARVLDVFAGTGAIALEALSRGAAAAVPMPGAVPAALMLRHTPASYRSSAAASSRASSPPPGASSTCCAIDISAAFLSLAPLRWGARDWRALETYRMYEWCTPDVACV